MALDNTSSSERQTAFMSALVTAHLRQQPAENDGSRLKGWGRRRRDACEDRRARMHSAPQLAILPLWRTAARPWPRGCRYLFSAESPALRYAEGRTHLVAARTAETRLARR